MTPKDKNLITFIDLFAGIGGMRIAFESLGARCLLTCEIDKNALITYKKNYKPTHNHIYAEDVINLQSKSIPKEAEAAVCPSSLFLKTQSSFASVLRIKRSGPNPAFTKALT